MVNDVLGIVVTRWNDSRRCNVKINGCIAKTIQIGNMWSSWWYSAWYRSNTPHMCQCFFVINSVELGERGERKIVTKILMNPTRRITYRIELLDSKTNKWESFGESGCQRTCSTSNWMLLVKNRSSKLWDLKNWLRQSIHIRKNEIDSDTHLQITLSLPSLNVPFGPNRRGNSKMATPRRPDSARYDPSCDAVILSTT